MTSLDMIQRRVDNSGSLRLVNRSIPAAHLPGDAGVIELLRKKGYTVEPVAPAAEEAIRRALHSYREAYQSLDASAAAAVWPSVDRRALTRVFATLKSQGLEFERCAITMSDTQATVSCRGLLQVVPKFGSQ